MLSYLFGVSLLETTEVVIGYQVPVRGIEKVAVWTVPLRLVERDLIHTAIVLRFRLDNDRVALLEDGFDLCVYAVASDDDRERTRILYEFCLCCCVVHVFAPSANQSSARRPSCDAIRNRWWL